jgi:CDP-diacylglycerol---serine O-phosphatidyltransferase
MATAEHGKRPRNVPIRKMIPNMITLTALATGMTSIKFAISDRWEAAVLAIVAAAFMDAFDGAAARLLKAQSKLGAELDSFSDFICFGVAPAIVIFLWTLGGLGKYGWPVALIFAIAVALRLARFNIAAEEKDPDNPLNKYFSGVPSPLGAGLAILPMIVSFQLDPAVRGEAKALALVTNPKVIAVWMILVGAMMVSSMPTFSSKQIRIPYKMKVPALALFGILVASLLNDPWPTLTLMGIIYIASLPLGIAHYSRKASAQQRGHQDPDEENED